MIGPLRRRRLIATCAYVGICLVIMFFELMPLAPGRPGPAAPDLALCLTLAWVLRRPDQLPVLVIATMMMLGDIMLGRPFGLWSLIVLVGSEFLRGRGQVWADQPFLFEWLRVSLLMGLMMVAARVIMVLFLLPVPGLAPIAMQWLATVVAYPLVVLVIHMIGVRRMSPAEIEMMVH
ncbi:MAG: rod shape-determining protein MreD [Paracoccus sp. (in: a-proteobacteria)]